MMTPEEEKLQHLKNELHFLQMFIWHHSSNTRIDFTRYDDRILEVKYEIGLQWMLINKRIPDDYHDIVEVYGSSCCEDEDE